jgi:autotransporter-associated beta strand protein
MTQSTRLHHRKKMKPRYFARTSALSLILALPAGADVIYSNLKDIAIPATFSGVYLDVDTGNWNTNANAPQSGWDINPFFGGSALWNSPGFQPVRSGTGSTNAVLNLAEDTTVGSGSVFSTFTQGPGGQNPGGPGFGASETHMGNGVGQFVSGSEGYIGFRMTGGNYGWMRVVLTNNTGGAMIKEWAYENSGASIGVANVKHSGSTVTLDSVTGSFTVSSAITDSGGATNLEKTSSGTVTLTGTSTYTGSTTVSAGSMLVNGVLSGTSDTTVSSGALLGGSGSIANGVSVLAGGTLSPGASIESLGLGSLDLDGSLLIEWDTTTSPNIDLLNIAGTLNLGSNSSITFTNLGAGSLDMNSAYVFATYGEGGLTGTFNTVNLLPAGFTIDYNYGGLNQIAIVPEPSSLLITILLSMPILLRRKR